VTAKKNKRKNVRETRPHKARRKYHGKFPIRRPTETPPRTKAEVDRMSRCGDMAIWNFPHYLSSRHNTFLSNFVAIGQKMSETNTSDRPSIIAGSFEITSLCPVFSLLLFFIFIVLVTVDDRRAETITIAHSNSVLTPLSLPTCAVCRHS